MAKNTLEPEELNLGPQYHRLEGVFLQHMETLQRRLSDAPGDLPHLLGLLGMLAALQRLGDQALFEQLTSERVGLEAEEVELLQDRLCAVKHELERLRTGQVEPGELAGLAELLAAELGEVAAELDGLLFEADEEEDAAPGEAPLAGLDL